MIRIRCKNCNKHLESNSAKTKCCGCENMTTLTGEKITALDLSLVELVTIDAHKNKQSVFSKEDLEYQEARRNRKVKRLNFEIR